MNLPICFFEISVVLSIFFVRQLGIRHKHRGNDNGNDLDLDRMVVLSLVFGLFTGNLDAVADAAMDGAASAVELSVSMAGILCLWSGVMES